MKSFDLLLTKYSYTSDFGLMFYREASRATKWRVDNARWYDPSLGRFAQADTIVPSGVQGWDRYAYVNNSPVNYTDPSGHKVCDEEYGCEGRSGNERRPPTNNGGSGGQNLDDVIDNSPMVTWQGGYVGGASPANVYQWQDFGSSSSSDASYELVEVFADILNIVAMNSPTAAATLQVLLAYATSEAGDVVNIEITIVNEGESSAILQEINMSEESLPNFHSCTITTNCYFKPVSQVSIDPGEVEFITICQNCLEDRTNIFSHPFYPNKDNYIEVFMVLSMPTYTGSNGVENKNHPFIYTIPPR